MRGNSTLLTRRKGFSRKSREIEVLQRDLRCSCLRGLNRLLRRADFGLGAKVWCCHFLHHNITRSKNQKKSNNLVSVLYGFSMKEKEMREGREEEMARKGGV